MALGSTDQLEDAAFRAVGQKIDLAVRTGPHIADALAKVFEHAVLANDPAVFDVEVDQLRACQRSNQKVALPVGIFRAFVKRQTRWCDGRVP